METLIPSVTTDILKLKIWTFAENLTFDVWCYANEVSTIYSTAGGMRHSCTSAEMLRLIDNFCDLPNRDWTLTFTETPI